MSDVERLTLSEIQDALYHVPDEQVENAKFVLEADYQALQSRVEELEAEKREWEWSLVRVIELEDALRAVTPTPQPGSDRPDTVARRLLPPGVDDARRTPGRTDTPSSGTCSPADHRPHTDSARSRSESYPPTADDRSNRGGSGSGASGQENSQVPKSSMPPDKEG